MANVLGTGPGAKRALDIFIVIEHFCFPVPGRTGAGETTVREMEPRLSCPEGSRDRRDRRLPPDNAVE